MKLGNINFDDYIKNINEANLHPKLAEKYKKIPKNMSELKNMIFYGPSGVGKYTQMLSFIKSYSGSELKYEKKISITFNKSIYSYKISDIHFEIDMALLGCQSKLLWNEIYTHIIDILLTRPNKYGFIVCKNFHEIHNDLLENLYSYMQTTYGNTYSVKFIILTEHISFIPTNILNCCQVINVPRPSRLSYNKCLKTKLKNNVKLMDITNIKHILELNIQTIHLYDIICNKIIKPMNDIKTLDFLQLREHLYDILIYNLNITDCIWYILYKLINSNKINLTNVDNIIIKTQSFLFYYNNNYRPIYHLENYIVYLINQINEFTQSV